MYTKIKAFLTKSIKSKKLNVFGLFLLFSFMILVLSKLSKSYTETITIPVKYKNIPEEIVLTNNQKQSVRVKVTTHGFNLLASYFKKPKIELDFSEDVSQTKHSYVWESKTSVPALETEFGSNFEIKNIVPDTLHFPYSILALKKVPVKLNTKITFASGYDTLLGFSAEPDSINVIGSEEIIDKITFVETSEFKQNNVKETITSNVSLVQPIDDKTVKFSQNTIQVSGEVEKFTEGTLEVSLTVINLPSHIRINYFPKTVKVSYEVSLDNYKKVTPSDFRIECNFNANQQSYLVPELKQKPDFVKRVKLKQKKIEYIITQ